MSHRTLDILFEVSGQSLYFDAPEGRPSTVTSSQVWSATDGEESPTEDALSGSAAIETNPNTTFDAASGCGEENPRLCYLAATTGITVGRRYLAANALGDSEWIDVTAVNAGEYVVAREPMVNLYQGMARVGNVVNAASTFASTRITHALQLSWLSDVNNLSAQFDPNPGYRWRLQYVVGGVTHLHDVYFDVVRYAARHDVTGLDVDRAFPGWIDRLPTYYREDQGAAIIQRAFEDIKFDLYNEMKPDQEIRNREAVNELVILRSGFLVDSTEPNERRYRERFQQIFSMSKVSVSTSQDAAANKIDPAHVWRR